ncbi:MAG: alpha-1,4-glucan--maltose-1-phosphate maltosyltransferase [Bacteroidota bacterium]
MQNRVIIQNVYPEIEGGKYFIKRVAGERIVVTADIFGDGHDHIRTALNYRKQGRKKWQETPMMALGNDEWTASFVVEEEGFYDYKVEAWVDRLLDWYEGFKKKYAAGQDMKVELQIGVNFLEKAAETYSKATGKPLTDAAKILQTEDYPAAVSSVMSEGFQDLVAQYPFKQFVTTYDKNLRVRVGRKKELFSAWYEFFPRSTAAEAGKHGTFKEAERIIPRIAELGFDVIYLPPIHPVGKVNRKGKNNATTAQTHEPGSPWAIGSEEGGHKAINPALGTLKDFKHFIQEAKKYGIEIAMDIAFQAAPDHPWIKAHPAWFIWRPDGTIAYAENPPKKYQDIVPINFETEDWKGLWEELTSVFLYWAKQGVKIFRVDNPHTKAFRFWEYCIEKVQKKYPETIFLAEAFTRPKIMAELAKLGYTQSYTYFTWRNDKKEMQEYMTELTKTESREYYRPNFWPNTPDILAYEMMHANANQFVKRFLLAATLSSNYGMYGPAYEFMDNTPMGNGKEEYFNSEKYEIKVHDWSKRNRMTEIITQINRIRRENSALQDTFNIHFTKTSSEHLMSYVKMNADRSNIIWCIVNFDPYNTQSGMVEVPKELLGIKGDMRLRLYDLLRNETYYWTQDWNYVEINPSRFPAHVMKLF